MIPLETPFPEKTKFWQSMSEEILEKRKEALSSFLSKIFESRDIYSREEVGRFLQPVRSKQQVIDQQKLLQMPNKLSSFWVDFLDPFSPDSNETFLPSVFWSEENAEELLLQEISEEDTSSLRAAVVKLRQMDARSVREEGQMIALTYILQRRTRISKPLPCS